jgi:D-threo-aldose 1-dehydrogenase
MAPGGALEGLRELQRQGLVRYVGVTGYDLDILVRLVETGEFDAVLNYNRYDLFTQEAKWQLLPAAARHQVAYVAGSPLHSGLLGARRESRVAQMEKRGEDTSAVKARLARIDELTASHSDSLSRMALRYLLSDPQVAVVIPSASKIAQVEDNMAASEAGPLAPDLVEAIEQQ